MDHFEFLKWTDAQIAAAKALPADRSTKLTTDLWMNLSNFTPEQRESKLLLQPVRSPDDWQQMADLRSEVEARIGDFSLEQIQEMISQIERCQNKLRLSELLPQLSVEKQADVLLDLMSYVFPKRKAVEVSGLDAIPGPQVILSIPSNGREAPEFT